MRRSAWVPLPTPGAPTRMMRAALLIFLIVIVIARLIGEREGSSERAKLGRTLPLSREEKLEASKWLY